MDVVLKLYVSSTDKLENGEFEFLPTDTCTLPSVSLETAVIAACNSASLPLKYNHKSAASGALAYAETKIAFGD
jgi:hypothetical protein